MKPKHIVEYALIRLLETGLKILPMGFALWIGEQLGSFLSLVLPGRRALIVQNLERSFPNKTSNEIQEIARRVWKNLGRNAVEFIRLPKLTATNENDYLIWEGVEHVERALEKGKGIVFVANHFTNWEVAGWATQYKTGRLLAIARPMKNPLVEKWIQKKRTAGGNRIALHRDAVRASFKWLKGNNVVGILVDQNLYTGGVFVNFFDRPAATTTLPALLHIRTGAAVIFIYTLRKGRKFVVHYDAPFKFPDAGEMEKQIQIETQMISDRLQELVAKYPENWFWIHNRWKRQPE